MTLTDRIAVTIDAKACAIRLLKDSPYGSGAIVQRLRADLDLLTAIRDERDHLQRELHKWQQIAVDLNPQYGRFLHPGGPHDAAELT